MSDSIRGLAAQHGVLTPQEIKASYIRHMVILIQLEDWHGVADAASDLREIEARHPALKAMKLG